MRREAKIKVKIEKKKKKKKEEEVVCAKQRVKYRQLLHEEEEFFSTVLPTYDKILTIRTKCDLAEKENRIYIYIYISIVTNEKEFFLK